MKGKKYIPKKNGYVALLVLLVSVAIGALYTAYSFEPLLQKKSETATTTAEANVPESQRVYQNSSLEGINAANNLKAQLQNRNQNTVDQ